METKRTSIEWLEYQIQFIELNLSYDNEAYLMNFFNQAKQMEKEQIMKAYLAGESDGDHLINSAKLYFKKTYGK